MTCGAIRQPGQHNAIIGEPRPVAVQAPAHIQILTRLSHGHPAELTVAGLAVYARRNMWAMVEINEIRQYKDRYPLDRLILINCVSELLQVSV